MKTKTNFFTESKWRNPLELNNNKSLILFFGNDVSALDELKRQNPKSTIVGCSSAGVVVGEVQMSKGSQATFLDFENSSFKTMVVSMVYLDSFKIGEKIMEEFSKTENLKGVLVFTEGLKCNGAKLAEGIHANNKNNVPVSGGLAADELSFTKTWCYCDKVVEDSVVAVAFYGDVEMSIGSRAGIKSFGVERKITKADKNVLYELDGKPALQIFKEFLGEEESAGLPASALRYPVEISKNFETDEGLVRTPILVDEKLGTITFTGEIPEGKSLRLMMADLDEVIHESSKLSENLKNLNNDADGENFLNIIISCAARKIILGTDVDEELFDFNKQVEKRKGCQVGFYAYGEITFVNKECSFVNQTLTYVSMYEKKKAKGQAA